MEERISKCTRCVLQRGCVYRPATGKGDLKPEILLVFHSEGNGNDRKKIMDIRQLIKKHFILDKVYHTFAVRCQPKSCTHLDNLNCFSSKCLVDQEQTCRVTRAVCEGIPIMPGDIEIISCLHYLIEEIDILSPQIVVLFGDRTSYFTLKAYGLLDSIITPSLYMINGRHVLATVEADQFTSQDAKELVSYLHSEHAV
jgi:uracil-DNA glycosylase